MAYPEPWERWKAVWQHAFFAVALGLGTLGAVTGGHAPAGLAVRLGLVAALAGWYGYWFGWAAHRRRPAGAVHLPYLIGAAVLWAVMAAVDPALLAVGVAALIPYCMRRPMWSAAAVVVAVSGVWLGQDLADGGLSGPAVVTCLLGVGTVLVVAGYIATLDRQGRARQRLLDQLAAAQAELAAAERAAGTLAERQRLARDIHDTLTQGFASIAMLDLSSACTCSTRANSTGCSLGADRLMRSVGSVSISPSSSAQRKNNRTATNRLQIVFGALAQSGPPSHCCT